MGIILTDVRTIFIFFFCYISSLRNPFICFLHIGFVRPSTKSSNKKTSIKAIPHCLGLRQHHHAQARSATVVCVCVTKKIYLRTFFSCHIFSLCGTFFFCSIHSISNVNIWIDTSRSDFYQLSSLSLNLDDVYFRFSYSFWTVLWPFVRWKWCM